MIPSLNDDKITEIQCLNRHNVIPSKICSLIKEKYGKHVTPKKIRNLRQKLPTEDVSFLDHMKSEEEKGGFYSVKLNDDGKVHAIFMCTKSMFDAFKRSAPPLIQIDTTFDMERAQYKVM